MLYYRICGIGSLTILFPELAFSSVDVERDFSQGKGLKPPCHVADHTAPSNAEVSSSCHRTTWDVACVKVDACLLFKLQWSHVFRTCRVQHERISNIIWKLCTISRRLASPERWLNKQQCGRSSAPHHRHMWVLHNSALRLRWKFSISRSNDEEAQAVAQQRKGTDAQRVSRGYRTLKENCNRLFSEWNTVLRSPYVVAC
jgi:hypothetical protein